MKIIIAALILVLVPFQFALGETGFIVKDIRVEGLQRITEGTVFNYLPVKVGDRFSNRDARGAIRALYKTGFFKNVKLRRDGQALIVTVVERPSIASIKIKGSKDISENDLKKSLKEIGLAEGRVFNRSILDRVERELELQYFSRGNYSVLVLPKVTQLERNRVSIVIEIIEGNTAKIREINIIGNSVYKDKLLLKQFSLSPTGMFSFFGKADQYSKQKLRADIENLKNYYQNRGYLEFDVESTQVAITPDRENITITLNVTEGKKYIVSDYKVAGQLVISEEKIRKLISIKPGDHFSRKEVTESTKRITDKLGEKGYAFANVNAIPDVDKANAKVVFTFYVDPGKRVYVRRINFSGNAATQDNVLRREMRQLEGSWYSTKKLQQSRLRLQRLGFFDEVNMETPQVPGTSDQVDINVAVKERPTGNLIFGLGYSDVDGFLVNGSVTEKNLFGTGNEMSFSYDNSKSVTSLNLRYINPYHTKGGISRGFSIFQTDIDAKEADIASYTNSTLGASIFYGIPTSEVQTLRLGLSFESNELTVGSDAPLVATDFIETYGADNSVYKLTLGWSQNSLNSAIIPTSGTLQNIFFEFTPPGSDLTYYKLTYDMTHYFQLTKQTAFRMKMALGYGNGYDDTEELPFYKNYYAGGSSTVRGYKPRSLGPRDLLTDDPIGGSKRILGNMEYQFPVPGAGEANNSMRLSLFVDGGMVYGAKEEPELGEIRYTGGLAFNWFSPIGPLSLSYAAPLNEEEGDDIERVQFSIGVPLR